MRLSIKHWKSITHSFLDSPLTKPSPFSSFSYEWQSKTLGSCHTVWYFIIYAHMLPQTHMQGQTYTDTHTRTQIVSPGSRDWTKTIKRDKLFPARPAGAAGERTRSVALSGISTRAEATFGVRRIFASSARFVVTRTSLCVAVLVDII